MRAKAVRASAAIGAVALVAMGWPAQAQMQTPFPHPAATALRGPQHCAPPPASSKRLDVIVAYTVGDASYSKVDPARAAARDAAMAPVNAFTAGAAQMANKYVRSRGTDITSAMCALDWLSAWAATDAMTQMPDHNAQFARSVNLAAWAMIYGQVRDVQYMERDPRPAIALWLGRMAADMRAHTTALRNTTGRNNHRYWAGFAAMAVAMDTGDRALANWALASARIGLDQVDSAGALPLELARKTKARHYHIYAAMPLVMIAEIAAANGTDLYSYRGGALHRLVAFSLGSLASPAALTQMAGAEQDPMTPATRRYDNQRIAWIEFYNRRFKGRVPVIADLLTNRPLVNNEIGGDMTLLAGAE